MKIYPKHDVDAALRLFAVPGRDNKRVTFDDIDVNPFVGIALSQLGVTIDQGRGTITARKGFAGPISWLRGIMAGLLCGDYARFERAIREAGIIEDEEIDRSVGYVLVALSALDALETAHV